MFFSKFTEIRDRIWTRPPNFYIRPGSSAVKSLLAMWETHVRTLGREYPLEKEMVADSSVLAWGIHGQRSLAGCNSWGCKSWKRLSDHYLLTYLFPYPTSSSLRTLWFPMPSLWILLLVCALPTHWPSFHSNSANAKEYHICFQIY